MNNVLLIIKKEFARFFKDKRMVITVLLPGILIYILYSVMGSVFSDMGKVDGDIRYSAYVINMPASLESPLSSVLDIQEDTDIETAKNAVQSGSAGLVIVFPQDFDGVLSGNSDTAANVEIYYNSSNEASYNGYFVVTAILDSVNKPLFTVNYGGVYDLAEERDVTGKVLSTIVPMLMFALLASACIAVAPESIAGEKERGTMATMLITPVKRWQLALGKIISLSCFALLSGISSFLGVILSLPKLMGGFIGGEVATFYSVGDYFMIFGIIISTVLVIISAFSVLSALAKSVKEASTLITPLMIVIILLGMATMFVSSSPAVWLFAIPVLGGGLSIASIMQFTITPLGFALAFLSNIVLAAALVVVLAFMFKSEKVMFNK